MGMQQEAPNIVEIYLKKKEKPALNLAKGHPRKQKQKNRN